MKKFVGLVGVFYFASILVCLVYFYFNSIALQICVSYLLIVMLFFWAINFLSGKIIKIRTGRDLMCDYNAAQLFIFNRIKNLEEKTKGGNFYVTVYPPTMHLCLTEARQGGRIVYHKR